MKLSACFDPKLFSDRLAKKRAVVERHRHASLRSVTESLRSIAHQEWTFAKEVVEEALPIEIHVDKAFIENFPIRVTLKTQEKEDEDA